MSSDSRTIAAALALVGVEDPLSAALARAHLDALRITNPQRDRLSNHKQAALTAALHAAFCFHCPQAQCGAAARASSLTPLLVRKEMCVTCLGSNARAGVEVMLRECVRAGITSVCVVGGSPALREELTGLLGGAICLTLVEGTQTPDLERARAHVRGHDVVVICAGSQLTHKLSNTYSAWKAEGHIITSPRRGAESVAAALARHARQRVLG